MKLVPVIELVPMDFAQEGRQAPRTRDKQAWENYWRCAIGDAGLNVTAVYKGSWFVALDELSHNELKIIIEKELSEHCPPWDEVTALYGGCFLGVDGIVEVIEPNCCGTLSNIEEWIEAVDYEGETEKDLWIGHPWLVVRGDGDDLHISWAKENGKPARTGSFRLNRAQLRLLVHQAKARIDEFACHITPFVEAITGKADSEIIVQKLVYDIHPD